MLRGMSEKSTEALIAKNIIEDRKRNIYVYGFEVIYSTAICFASVLLLGILQRRVLQTVIFLVCFVALRMFAGGYHAPTYLGCFFVTNAAYLVERILAEAVAGRTAVQSAILLISAFYIWREAPAFNPHRRLAQEKLLKNKFRARVCLGIIALSAAVCGCLGFFLIMSEVTATTAVVAGMIVASNISNRRM